MPASPGQSWTLPQVRGEGGAAVTNIEQAQAEGRVGLTCSKGVNSMGGGGALIKVHCLGGSYRGVHWILSGGVHWILSGEL